MDLHTSSTAKQRGWGDPDSPGFSQNMLRVQCPGPYPLWVHRRVAPLFEQLIKDFHIFGYQPRTYGGYNNRDVRGRPGVKSNHAWGLAGDFNADKNPMTTDGRAITDMPREIANAAATLGFLWGAKYIGSRKDPMHFEFKGTPIEADTIAKNLKTPKVTPTVRRIVRKPSTPSYRRPVRNLHLWDRGEDVKWLQYKLGLKRNDIDGIFGPQTYRYVITFQKRNYRLLGKPDGIVGPRTRALLDR